MKVTIKHKFLNHYINLDTKILLLGTFNPDIKDNQAGFFYGRPQNRLWEILPEIFDEELTKSSELTPEKKEFMRKHQIDFIDLIEAIEVEENELGDSYNKDAFLDERVTQWKNVVVELKKLPKLKGVGFTRSTYSDIPIMKEKVNEIKEYCKKRKIIFTELLTPSGIARIRKDEVLKDWEESELFKS